MKNMSKRIMALPCLGFLIAFGFLGCITSDEKKGNEHKKTINVGLAYMEMSAHSMGLIVGAEADYKVRPYLPLADFILEDSLKHVAVSADINATSNFLMENETKNILQTHLVFDSNGEEASLHIGGTQKGIDYGTKMHVSGELIGTDKVRMTIKYSISEPPKMKGQKKNEGKTTITCKLGETVLLATQSQISGSTRKLLGDLSALTTTPTAHPLIQARTTAKAKISADLKKSKDRLEIILLNPSLVHEDSPKAQ